MGNHNYESRARFTISFDSEGKWGVADQGPKTLSYIDGSGLRDAYCRILALLRKYEVSATFGIVGALCMDHDELRDRVSSVPKLLYCNRDWLAPVRQDINNGKYDGWSHPEILAMLMEDGKHELCSHGGFHVPYDEINTPVESIDRDLSLIHAVQQEKGIFFENIIFPRNVVGYLKLLRDFGFHGYREMDPREQGLGLVERLMRLSYEFTSFDLKDMIPVGKISGKSPPPHFNKPVALSAGKFLNARIGIRNSISSRVSVQRIKKFVDEAVSSNLRVHFYTHPHNFIRDSGMFSKLEKILMLVSDYRDSGVLDVITMKDELGERYGIFN
ncbi:polysaccharide deacetylase family protein [Castellaniella caeni]|uniref:polysaccharide deacetylase family protein n=1 Tax=Castellaniella caeni TaxID=266123 RepID=UPI0012EE5F49|nr:polysaccharide deacetylase family protein [Castellaniella caeni]